MKNILAAFIFCFSLVSCGSDQSSICETYVVITKIEKHNDKLNRVSCSLYNEHTEAKFIDFTYDKVQIYLRKDRDVKVGDTIRFDLK